MAGGQCAPRLECLILFLPDIVLLAQRGDQQPAHQRRECQMDIKEQACGKDEDMRSRGDRKPEIFPEAGRGHDGICKNSLVQRSTLSSLRQMPRSISGIPLVEHVNSMYRGAWKGLSMACQWGALGRIGQLPRSTIFFSNLSNRAASDMTVLLTISYGGLSWVAKSGNVAVSGKVSYLAKKDR